MSCIYETVGSTATTTPYYILNLQGDVIHLVDASGVPAASYSYDPYGEILTASGSLANLNPLRYRGYYYDTESGFYYLQSRYYDPVVKRFLNADSYGSTGQGFLGYNMFAYCGNNPVNACDPNGFFSIFNSRSWLHTDGGNDRYYGTSYISKENQEIVSDIEAQGNNVLRYFVLPDLEVRSKTTWSLGKVLDINVFSFAANLNGRNLAILCMTG